MIAETVHELLGHLGGHRVVLPFVEVFIDANHHIRDQRTLRISRRQRDVFLQRAVEVIGLLVALRQLV